MVDEGCRPGSQRRHLAVNLLGRPRGLAKGQEYRSGASMAVITSAAFQSLRRLHRIDILCDEGNTASARVALKNGYERDGSAEPLTCGEVRFS